MSFADPRGALKEYRNIGAQGGVEFADPHRLIQMLMEGALEKISAAKGFMIHGDIAQKGSHISWAISIIDGLKVSLDKSTGGDMAQNLDDLYSYMQRRLLESNLNNEPVYLDEVAGLMREVKEAWDAIPEDAKKLAKPST